MAMRDSQNQMRLAQLKRDLENGIEAIATEKLLSKFWRVFNDDEPGQPERDCKIYSRFIQGQVFPPQH